MATQFKKGDLVKVNTVVPHGPVEAVRMSEEGEIFYSISWVDVNSSNQTRWFSETELIAE